ncbi:MAG: nucleotide sugar dehydrogenase [Pseudomonadota bacterium]
MKIAVAGLGYVGLSNAVMLAQHHDVIAYDIDEARVAAINERKAPFQDVEISAFLAEKSLLLKATTVSAEAFEDADFALIATPTNFEEDLNAFATDTVETVIAEALKRSEHSTIIVKSTVPVGFTKRMQQEFDTDRILFCPEFLREGKALYDSLNPSRIIIGDRCENAEVFARLLTEAAQKQNIDTLYMSSGEAEAVKLFSNSYLAMRVAFFNELDSYALSNGLDAKKIIEGIGYDPRIGDHHNNPSFGYGGYCLPKDARQLLSNFDFVPQSLISAIVQANETRKRFITDQVLARKPAVVGIYKLAMKAGSDNFREAAVLDVMTQLAAAGVELVIYEPHLEAEGFEGHRVMKEIAAFKDAADLVLANRYEAALDGLGERLICRDIFGRD